jgi:hypothetical protein
MQADFHPSPREALPEAHPQDFRKLRYKLRTFAGRVLGKNTRTARCGHRLVGAKATVLLGDHGAYVGGVETCGSVWACPVCAAIVSEKRRKQVARILDAHDRVGGAVFMAAFTIPHEFHESARALRVSVSTMWSQLIAGKAWTQAKKRFGVVGTIRALEVTHGKNGWHPHLHVLFLTDNITDNKANSFRLWLRDRWISIASRIDAEITSGDRLNMLPRCLDFRRAEAVRAAGDYVAKWGVDSELTKSNLKQSRRGGRSPWQILIDAEAGDHYSRMLFREYANSFKGARQVTFSLGLRDLYDHEPELSDYELAKQDCPFNGDEIVGHFPRLLWFRICRANVVSAILQSAEIGGWPAILQTLRAHKLALPEEAPNHDKPTKELPPSNAMIGV